MHDVRLINAWWKWSHGNGLMEMVSRTHKCMMEMVCRTHLEEKKMHDGKILISCALAIVIFSLLEIIVFKPGTAWQVDPGPGCPRGWTGLGLSKDRPVQWLGQTELTQQVNPWPGRPRWDPMFFFLKCGIWNTSVYILYVKKKRLYFFNVG